MNSIAKLKEFLKQGIVYLQKRYPKTINWCLIGKNFLIQRWKLILVTGTIVFVFIFVILAVGVFIKFKYDESEIRQGLNAYRSWLEGKGEFTHKPAIKIYGIGDSLIGEYYPEKASRITLQNCSKMKWLNLSAVAAEDREFYKHKGVSIRGIFRALFRNITALGVREGGGTITQQLARNLYTDRKSRSLLRKIYETYAAKTIEEILSKDEILCLYMNKIYMGEGRIGAEEASLFYFRKNPWDLTVAESAMIVGLFPSPARYSPLNNIKASMNKMEKVFIALEKGGHLKEKDKEKAVRQFKSTWGLEDKKKNLSSGTIGIYGASRYFKKNLAPDVNEYAIQFLRGKIDEDTIQSGGIKIYTSIDPKRQSAAVNSVRSSVVSLRNNFQKKSKAHPEETIRLQDGLNGVLVSLDPSTGYIKALVGGYSANDSSNQYQRVITMLRQPGSAIKGFLYGAAIQEGILNRDSEVVDEAISIKGYSPRNWYSGYKGKVSLRYSVARSINTVAVKTLDKIGISRFRQYLLGALGLNFISGSGRFPDNLTLALGSGEVTPLEMAKIYSPIINGGYTIEPKLFLKIADKNGTTLWEDMETSPGKRIFSRSTCADVIYLMESVLEEEGTADWITKKRSKSPDYLPFPIAGKTGTVQTDSILKKKFPGLDGIHDAWFVGLVPGEVTVVWFGNDEGAPFHGSGSGTAGGTWASYAQHGIKDKTGKVFYETSGIDPNPDGSLEGSDLPEKTTNDPTSQPEDNTLVPGSEPETYVPKEEKPKG